MSQPAWQAFAVEENGVLLVDTVRCAEWDARQAALKLLKRPGIGWRDLERSGYHVVRVTVQAASMAKVKAKGREHASAPR